MTSDTASSSPANVDGLLIRARKLARRGRFAEALECLVHATSRGECTEAAALDLRARICAQQGYLLQAEACWVNAQALEGDNPAYAEALSALRRRQTPRANMARVAAVTLSAIAVLLIAVSLVSGGSERAELATKVQALDARIAALSGERTRSAMQSSSEQLAFRTALARNVASSEARLQTASLDQHKRTIAEVGALATAIRDSDAGAQRALAELRLELDQRHREWATAMQRLQPPPVNATRAGVQGAIAGAGRAQSNDGIAAPTPEPLLPEREASSVPPSTDAESSRTPPSGQ